MKWCVDGFLEWQRIGLSEPAIIKEQREEYRTEMDSIATFIEECCEVDYKYRISAGELFNAYDSWAKQNNQHKMTNVKFGTEMQKKFERTTIKGKRYYRGLQIAKDSQYNPDVIQLNFK